MAHELGKGCHASDNTGILPLECTEDKGHDGDHYDVEYDMYF